MNQKILAILISCITFLPVISSAANDSENCQATIKQVQNYKGTVEQKGGLCSYLCLADRANDYAYALRQHVEKRGGDQCMEDLRLFGKQAGCDTSNSCNETYRRNGAVIFFNYFMNPSLLN